MGHYTRQPAGLKPAKLSETSSITSQAAGAKLRCPPLGFLPIYRDGDCRPDDPHGIQDRIRQRPSQSAEFVIVGGSLSIRFSTYEDAAHALAHLRKLNPSTEIKIAIPAS